MKKFFSLFFSIWFVLILCIFENIQASRCVGKNSRVLVCHCRRADDRAPGACHCFQLQLLLSQGDRPGRDAVAKFQPCPELSIHAWSLRWESKNPKISFARVAKMSHSPWYTRAFFKHQSNEIFYVILEIANLWLESRLFYSSVAVFPNAFVAIFSALQNCCSCDVTRSKASSRQQENLFCSLVFPHFSLLLSNIIFTKNRKNWR